MATGMQASPNFPLDFSADTWSADDVVRWAFLGELAEKKRSEWKEAVSYVLARLDRKKARLPAVIDPDTREAVGKLESFLLGMGPGLSASTEKAPVVWARLAIQYWLLCGGRHQPFLRKFSDWLEEQGSVGVIVAPRRRSRSASESSSTPRTRGKAKQLVMSVFLLDTYPADHFVRRSVRVPPVEKQVTKPSVQRAAGRGVKETVGSHLYRCIEKIIQDAVTTGSIRNLSAKRDPKTGRYQFTGLVKDLFVVVSEDPKLKGWYQPSTIKKTITHFVACRRSWT